MLACAIRLVPHIIRHASACTQLTSINDFHISVAAVFTVFKALKELSTSFNSTNNDWVLLSGTQNESASTSSSIKNVLISLFFISASPSLLIKSLMSDREKSVPVSITDLIEGTCSLNMSFFFLEVAHQCLDLDYQIFP